MADVEKIGRTILGIFIVLVGLVLSLPGIIGPGLLIIFLGLVLLAKDYQWADHKVQQIKAKLGRSKEKPTEK